MILEFVKNVKIEFQNGIESIQTYCCISKFSVQEYALVELEIQKLLEKGVVTPSIHENGGFISTIFFHSEKDRSYHTILNLKQFN